MRTIPIEDATFSRLQNHGEPFVDTIDMVINRALDALDANREGKTSSSQAGTVVVGSTKHWQGQEEFDPSATPNLAFTTVRSAAVDGRVLPNSESYWNSILIEVVRLAAKKLETRAIMDLLLANHIDGQKEDGGYKFIPEAGLSIQGQDANGAWKATYYLASAIGASVEVSFVWQNTPKAARPGSLGLLKVNSIRQHHREFARDAT